MGSFGQDLRYGMRMLIKAPSFTLIAVLTLALGIGANTAVFSVVNAVIWHPLPYEQPEQLVMVWERSIRERQAIPSPNPPAMFLAWRENKDIFSDVAAYEDAAIAHRSRFYLTGGSEPERIAGAYVSGNLFSLLGVRPVMGRNFTVEDEQPGRELVVVLSDDFWRRRFNADQNVIGKPLRLNDRSFTIVGVMPPEFKLTYPKPTELWTPLTFGPKERADWSSAEYKVVAHLKQGVTIQQARDAATRLTQQMLRPDRNSVQEKYAQLDRLHDYHFGQMRTSLYLLLTSVGAVLLIACVNIANLSLARAIERDKEIAVRAALGASRGRLIRQLITENLALSALGGVAGVLLAFWGRNLLTGLMPSAVPRSGDVKINAVVLVFAALISIAAGGLSGLLAALQASRLDLNETLKTGTQNATAQGRTRRYRDWLIIVEMALGLALLIDTGLMIRSLWQLHYIELGFNPKNILTMHFTIPPYRFNPDGTLKREFIESQQRTFVERVVENVKSLPGVVSVAATASVPLRGVDYFAGFDIAGKPPGGYGARYRVVGNDYFRTMGIRLLKGRLFTEQDTRESGRVAVISSEMARRFFPNEEPLGKRLDPSDWNAEVVGVVADVYYKKPDQPLEPAFYMPLSQGSFNPICLVVRTGGDPLQIAPAVRRAIWTEDKDQPLEGVTTMEQITAAAFSELTFISVTLGVFALIALLLGATGIYGVISYTVVQRRHEIGVRMALGAQRGDVLRLVVKQGMSPALAGIGVGLLGSFWLTRLVSGLLFGVGATDPLTYLTTTALLTFIAALACWVPARRATKVDPIISLRCE